MAISLEKGKKVSLQKGSQAGLGEILVNLNWNARPVKKGLFGMLGGGQGIDLDLGCLFELKDGQKVAVQALGNAFGSLRQPPFIALDGDDRTGAVTTGENLRIDGNKIAIFKRILVYTFIYEGVANWRWMPRSAGACGGRPEESKEKYQEGTLCLLVCKRARRSA